jgi:hypothetical protein
MDRNWSDFKSVYGNLAGAREAFEDACEILFKKIYPSHSVSQVKVKQGDGGIDIFVGELGVEPITVIQCKFFLDAFDASQKSQIRESFNTANTDERYTLKEWILCLPRVIDIDEHSWWFKWKNKVTSNNKRDSQFVSIKNGNELISLFKEYNLYNQVFKIEDSLKIDAIYKEILKPVKIKSGSGKPQHVLFNNYSKPVEPYYHQRQADIDFSKSILVNNLWVHGASGSGKTALINRNLINYDLDFCYCDLSPVLITSSEDILHEILYRIEEQFNIERNAAETNIIKQIDQILSRAKKNKIFIVIDELSIRDIAMLRDIASRLMKLVTYFCNQNTDGELKFIFSTIFDPKSILDDKSKASGYFQFIDCSDWSSDIEGLFHLLCRDLNLEIEYHKDEIISSVQCSPRTMKTVFRKILIADKIDQETIDKCIRLTLSEVI